MNGKIMRMFFVSIATMSLFLAELACAQAVLHVDNNPGDNYNPPAKSQVYSTIQQAIDAATVGDEVHVWPGIYTSLGSEVVNLRGKSIVLSTAVPMDLAPVVVDGEGARRCLVAASGEPTACLVRGIRLTRGFGGQGGCVLVLGSSPRFVDCVIMDGRTGVSASHGGGGAFVSGGVPEFLGCQFYGNASNGGGAVRVVADPNAHAVSMPVFVACRFQFNSALAGVGGAVRVEGHPNATARPSFSRCEFISNSGSGISIYYASPILTKCTLTGNYGYLGGGISFGSMGANSLSLNQSYVCGNTSSIATGDAAQIVGGGWGGQASCVAAICQDCDADSDGISFSIDNCPWDFNPEQADCDGNGIGDVCEIVAGTASDVDGDGVPDVCEPASCAGDISSNGIVDGIDLAAVLGAWGTSGKGEYPADVNGDGTVDGSDLAIVLGGWGPCPE